MPVPKKYDKDFFKTWSCDMAYILGFMYADGNITHTKRGNCYIAIYTADKKLLSDMMSCFRAEHKLSQRGNVYRVQIGSKEWFEDLGKLGLFPGKTKRMKLPKIPKKYLGDFVRGYFDGDGNVWFGFLNKHRTTPTKVLLVVFTSGALEFLSSLRATLQVVGITGGGIYSVPNENYARLTFSTRDALKICEIMYNAPHKLFLRRKKVVFEKFKKNLRE